MRNPRFSFKAFTSFALVAGGVVIATAGIVLFIAPPGRVANLTDWQLLGLDRAGWGAVRTTFALFFIIAAALHIYFNWAVFKAYLNRRSSTTRSRWWELGSSLIFVALLVVLTLRGAPPFSNVAALGERARASWPVPDELPRMSAQGASDPATAPATQTLEPAGTGPRTSGSGAGMGQLTLAALCQQEGVALSDAIARLEAIGVTASGNDRLQILAARADRVPSEMASVVRGYGMGQLTLSALCEQEGIALADAITRLEAIGITAQGDATLQSIAGQTSLLPAELANIVRAR